MIQQTKYSHISKLAQTVTILTFCDRVLYGATYAMVRKTQLTLQALCVVLQRKTSSVCRITRRRDVTSACFKCVKKSKFSKEMACFKNQNTQTPSFPIITNATSKYSEHCGAQCDRHRAWILRDSQRSETERNYEYKHVIQAETPD